MTPVDEDYLETVDRSGLLRTIGGYRYVAGTFFDDVLSQQQCFVEYCDSPLLTDPGLTAALFAELRSEFADACDMLLRAPATTLLTVPWERSVSYVRYMGKSLPPASTDPAIEVREAIEQDDELIFGWLSKAFVNGYQALGHDVTPAAAAGAAAGTMQAVGRRTYVALVRDRQVGHLTLLDDEVDEIEGQPRLQLVDMLVDPCPDRKTVGAVLVSAATGYAHREGKPLIGNVIHPVYTIDPLRGQRVLESLLGKGWVVDHVVWRATGGERG